MSHGRTRPTGVHRAQGWRTAGGPKRVLMVSRRASLAAVALLVSLLSAGGAVAAPPAPTLTPDIAAAINTTPTITLSAPGVRIIYRWQIDGGPLRAGALVPLAGLADGQHTLTARAFDALLAPSPVTTRTFVLDRVAPTAPTVTPALPSLTNQPTITVTLGGGAEPVTYRWKLDANPLQTGATVALTGLADGTHTLTANAVDAAGNVSPTTTRTMRVDRKAPSAPTINPSPSATAIVKSFPTSSLSGGGEPVIYQWRIDDGPVTSGATVSANEVGDGEHRLTAWTIDEAQNRSADSTWAFRLERTAPAPPILSAPAAGLSARRSELSAVVAIGTLQWSLTGPRALKGEGNDALRGGLAVIPDGQYALAASARSALGSVSATTVLKFTLDSTPPQKPAVVSGPTSSRGGPKPSFTWLGEPAGTYLWRVRRGDIIVQGPGQTSDRSVQLAPLEGRGVYRFSVRQIDPVGNASPEASWSFTRTGPARLAKPFGPLFPKPGRDVRKRARLVLHWVYLSGRPSRLFNVQFFNESGRKVYSGFSKRNQLKVPARLLVPGRRLYWQVWPFWGDGRGYARRPLGVSYFQVSPPGARTTTPIAKP